MNTPRSRFTVTFTPMPGTNGIRALRLLLKSAKRRFGLVAIDAREERAPTYVSNQIANTFAELRHDVATRTRNRSRP
jgi:hypothetical protein